MILSTNRLNKVMPQNSILKHFVRIYDATLWHDQIYILLKFIFNSDI